MIQMTKLCEILGFESNAYSVEYTGEDTNFLTPNLISYLMMGRQVTHDALEHNHVMLWEMELMLEDNIRHFTEELKTIQRHRATFYGPGK